jgi:hypothetical protein
VYVSVASSGADGDSCPVNMEVKHTHTIQHLFPLYFPNEKYDISAKLILIIYSKIFFDTPGRGLDGPQEA